MDLIGSEKIDTLYRNALSGNALAQFEIAYLYASGVEIPKDDFEAVKWYQSAAQQDHMISKFAQYALGKHYSKGDGVAMNLKEAVRYFHLAATQGLSDAQYCLAECYYLGHGIARNPLEASKWYQLAAEQGLMIAQFKLGLRYANGDGSPKNTLLGYMWLNISSVQGDRYAARCRDFLEKSMSIPEVTQAQKMSSDWMIAHHKIA